MANFLGGVDMENFSGAKIEGAARREPRHLRGVKGHRWPDGVALGDPDGLSDTPLPLAAVKGHKELNGPQTNFDLGHSGERATPTRV